MSDRAQPIDPLVVHARLEAIRSRIAKVGGDPSRVRIVAVTKTFGPTAVAAAIEAGITDIGENYGRELLATASVVASMVTSGAIETGPRWHFLGSIQRRDVPKLAPVVSVYEGVDRFAEGEAIARSRPGATVYVEVDDSGIAGRGGVRAGEAGALVAALRAIDLDVAGVMTIAPPGGGHAAAAAFALARRIAEDNGLFECSMGMSDDLELAVIAGSTAVRIGRALFGGRSPVPGGATMGAEEA